MRVVLVNFYATQYPLLQKQWDMRSKDADPNTHLLSFQNKHFGDSLKILHFYQKKYGP